MNWMKSPHNKIPCNNYFRGTTLPFRSISAVADSNPKSIGHLLWTFDVLWASLGEANSHVLRHIRIF